MTIAKLKYRSNSSPEYVQGIEKCEAVQLRLSDIVSKDKTAREAAEFAYSSLDGDATYDNRDDALKSLARVIIAHRAAKFTPQRRTAPAQAKVSYRSALAGLKSKSKRSKVSSPTGLHVRSDGTTTAL